jgi:Fe-S cluster assembly protein SufD
MSVQATRVAPMPSSAPSSIVDHYLGEHAATASTLPGSGLKWLARLRRDALDTFAGLGFPGPREEAWKYTRMTPIEKRAFRPQGELCIGFDEGDIEHLLFAGLPCHRLVFVNGRYTPQLSKPGKLGEGIRLASLAKALEETPELVEPHLARHADLGASGFAALNAAFLADGALVHLPRGAVLEHPVHLLFIATGQEDPIIAQPRILVVAGEGSQVSVIESYASLGEGTYFTNTVTEVVLEDNARVEHYKLQHEHVRAFHVATLQAHLDRDSRFTSHSVSFGGQLTRNDINAVLDAPGAECTLNGLYMVGGRQHVDFHTTVEHASPHGTSEEYYKGILDGHSRGVFNGRVHVHPDAQKTDSQQASKNLLLSRDAEVDTKPELEIYADDVKCSHGATVGQLDADMLFYLRARGIDKAAARGLLTYGFAQDIIDRIPLEPVRGQLEAVLVARVPDAETVRAMV